MTVIYYMRGIIVADEQDPRSQWSVDEKRTEADGLPPGFLPKPKTSRQNQSGTQLKRKPEIDTSRLKRAKRAHKSPKDPPKQEEE